MSLTSWLTDYVFMPLNIQLRRWGTHGTIVAIILNMTFIGLWHGADWTFLLFGIYHGNFIQATYAFIFGLLLGAIAIKTNSLIPSIFLHMAINGTLYLIPDKLFLNIPISICIGLVSLAFMIAAIMLLFITYKNFATQSEESDS